VLIGLVTPSRRTATNTPRVRCASPPTHTGLPDVFRCPFQTSPLDLDTDAFYPARRDRLDQQLTRIADGQAGAILSGVWAAHAGIFARGVSWQRFSQAQLLEICECVGGLGLAAVLRLMAEDHAGATGVCVCVCLARGGGGRCSLGCIRPACVLVCRPSSNNTTITTTPTNHQAACRTCCCGGRGPSTRRPR
jgi:hypothetical protein